MRDFDIELAKRNHPIQTFDGRPVRIVCYDVKGDGNPSILALITDVILNYEYHMYYYENGVCDSDNRCLDLVMAPTKRELEE